MRVGLTRPAPPVELEILPVYLDGGSIMVLRPRPERTWRLPYAGPYEVRLVVRHCLASRALRPRVIHSTSWRQDHGRLVLTHAAVVDPPILLDRLESWAPARCALARGSALDPPPLIGVDRVVEHALRHLAWLAVDDPATTDALDHRWHRALRPYRLTPFASFTVPPWTDPPDVPARPS